MTYRYFKFPSGKYGVVDEEQGLKMGFKVPSCEEVLLYLEEAFGKMQSTLVSDSTSADNSKIPLSTDSHNHKQCGCGGGNKNKAIQTFLGFRFYGIPKFKRYKWIGFIDKQMGWAQWPLKEKKSPGCGCLVWLKDKWEACKMAYKAIKNAGNESAPQYMLTQQAASALQPGLKYVKQQKSVVPS